MNGIEIRNLTKNFREKRAVDGLDMTVPQGAIYGFIGENGSGKSTTEKCICGLLVPSGGEIKLFGKSYKDPEVRKKIGVLIEAPGCFPNLSVWSNMKLQAANLGIKNEDEEIRRVLRLVRMEGSASNKFKNCSLGMRQRIGIAFALLGRPELLVLDEPINGLDADGMRIMREILTELSHSGVTVLISSHILGELEKIATHYGIIRGGKMIKEMTAEELSADCPTYVALKAGETQRAEAALREKFARVQSDGERGEVRVYGADASAVTTYLYRSAGIAVSEVTTRKISLEEYYADCMKEGR